MSDIDENGQCKQLNPLSLSGLPRNTAILVLTEPLWAFPGTWYYTYFALFLATVGLSAFQIGLITSIGLVSKIVLSLLGGHITDRWGRKRTLLFFDIVCWVIPTAIWAASTEFWQFAVGVILNNFVWIATPAWLCLLFEEAKTEDRTKIYAFNSVATILAGFASPFAGWVLRTQGIVPGMRWLLAGFCFSMILAVIIRGTLLRESHIGERIREKTQNASRQESFAVHWETLKFIFRSKALRSVLFIGIIYNFALNFSNTYNALYITKGCLYLNKDLIAAFPVMASVISLILIFIVIPRIHVGKEGKAIGFAMTVNLLGYVIFALAPKGWAPFAWLTMAAWAMASGLYIPVREGLWQNLIPDADRARVIALAAMLECLVILPAAPLGGWLFQVAPRCVYWTGALVVGASLIFIFRGSLTRRAAENVDEAV